MCFSSGNELEIVRIKTSFRVSRVKSGQNPDVRAARRQVRHVRSILLGYIRQKIRNVRFADAEYGPIFAVSEIAYLYLVFVIVIIIVMAIII